MTTPTELQFTIAGETLAARVDTLVIAGWTGRDTAAVEEHIAELEAIGVARPPSTPCFYRASASLLTQAPSIQVVGPMPSTSPLDGIAELADDDRVWSFTPTRPWRAGRYRLAIGTILEDLAGNSVARPFELDINSVGEKDAPPEDIHMLEFAIPGAGAQP